MNLPDDFVQRMNQRLKDEAEAFLSTYENKKTSGLRVNPLKLTVNAFKELFPYHLEEVPFCPTGFYYNDDIQPGKHPFHHAGLYYIQEPSAMFVAETLSPKPHERVLDLCAAPGGKTTQLAGMMKNKGLLIANEIHPKRVRALSENVERMGITNCIVTNETPERLAEKFHGFFDKILVDAPCSGEGMFRKDPEAIQFWSREHVEASAHQQIHILHSAYHMLKEGGTLVYSTCTFSPEENEQTIETFLNEHPDMVLVPIEKQDGIKCGVPEWTKGNLTDISMTARLWPHFVKGEGHFVARLKKEGSTPEWNGRYASSNVGKSQLNDFRIFEKNYLTTSISRTILAFKNQLYALPENCPSLEGMKVVRPGLHLGELKKNRFEPNHALSHALRPDEFKYSCSFHPDDDAWKKYLRGETLETGKDRGWMAVTIENFPLGWGKETKGILKNFYPKGLRK
ncbi:MULTISPECIES: RsmF rRNA methyltransferase first C-terminal domain-containing protein [Fictibacillus]|uniref:RsmF rRNA methyltransferase first C-terminal domain-containing protein n=1 Tax=Fictibacillus TaxID=1329200 RepID=UPI00041E3950